MSKANLFNNSINIFNFYSLKIKLQNRNKKSIFANKCNIIVKILQSYYKLIKKKLHTFYFVDITIKKYKILLEFTNDKSLS